MCSVINGLHDPEHFLLICDSFKEQNAHVNALLQNSGYFVLGNSFLPSLYGNERLSYEVNRSSLTMTITISSRQKVLTKDCSCCLKKLSRFLPFLSSIAFVIFPFHLIL